jgi:hypothetical protein
MFSSSSIYFAVLEGGVKSRKKKERRAFLLLSKMRDAEWKKEEICLSLGFV